MKQLGRATTAAVDSYEVPVGSLGSDIDEVPAGSNLLIAGPTMMGKSSISMDILSHGYEEGQSVLLVTGQNSAVQFLEQYGNPERSEGALVTAVDFHGAEEEVDTELADMIEYISSPSDLTGVGMGLAKCMQAIDTDAKRGTRMGLLSLSTLLHHTSPNRVFNFTHILRGRVSAANYLGVWTLDTDSHDDKVVNTLRGQFDYVAELRETGDGKREIRVLGGPDDWRVWEEA